MSDDPDEDSDNYKFIRTLMTNTPRKPMLVKYDADGDGTDPQGSRKMWPMVLGHSPDPDLSYEEREMVLCYQTTGSPKQRGWRCCKVALLIDPKPTTPNESMPDMTEEDVNRQSCVTDVELASISTAKVKSMPNDDHYQDIYDAIKNEYPVKAKYKGKFRKLWPLVLGKSPKPGSSGQTVERVLGYEFEYDGTAQNPPVWRCYKVEIFSGDIEATTGPDKPDFSTDQRDRQNCVMTPDPTLP